MFECDVMARESVIYKSKLLVEALINMVCELKNTSGSKKNCVKFLW